MALPIFVRLISANLFYQLTSRALPLRPTGMFLSVRYPILLLFLVDDTVETLLIISVWFSCAHAIVRLCHLFTCIVEILIFFLRKDASTTNGGMLAILEAGFSLTGLYVFL